MPNMPLITIPPSATHTHTVVFLHGRGDTARGLAASLPLSPTAAGHSLFEALPSLRWVFPTAPIAPTAAFAGDRTSQWFDIYDVRDFTWHEELQADGLRASVAALRAVLASEAALLAGRWDRVVLAGISQGAATAVHTLLNLQVPPLDDGPGRLAALMTFAARMPFPGRSLAETRAVLDLDAVPDDDGVLRNTPVFMEHCADDPLVPVKYGHTLRDTLTGFGMNAVWREYPEGGHWFHSPQGMDEAVTFLEATLGVVRAKASLYGL